MYDAKERRAHRRELADRLLTEYAGALPPGQILALVARTHRLIAREPGPWSAERGALCESIVRHHLTRRLAGEALVRSA